jgi:hypothetical protein
LAGNDDDWAVLMMIDTINCAMMAPVIALKAMDR